MKYQIKLFQTFVRINSLFTGGFINTKSDTLLVKAKVSSTLETM